MKKRVKDILERVEENNDIKIIFASEQSSRGRGFASNDSSHVIHFVYVRPVSEYLGIDEPTDKIREINYVKMKDGTKLEIDFTGYDIKKFMFLLRQSKPIALEMILCEKPYINEFEVGIIPFFKTYARRLPLYNYYKSRCKREYHRNIRQKRSAPVHSYLETLRCMLSAIYICELRDLPPQNLCQLIAELKGIVKQSLLKKTKKCARYAQKKSKSSQRKAMIEVNRMIDDFNRDTNPVPFAEVTGENDVYKVCRDYPKHIIKKYGLPLEKAITEALENNG